MLARKLLERQVRTGSLTVIDADGKTHRFNGAPGPKATIRLHDRSLHYKIFFNAQLHIGEAYMDGALTLEDGTSLYDFLDLCGSNIDVRRMPAPLRIMERLRRRLADIQHYNPIGRAQKKVAHHYDLSDGLFDLFLDSDRQYSCAYFTGHNDTLEVAQDNKKRHIATKLLLKPGMKVLDIGSGWGGLGLFLARRHGADVTGVTLSKEQHAVSNRRATEAGLADRARFHLRDYREERGRYDRIVSVGMLEHVGNLHYREYFGKLRELLVEDGVCLVHSIGRMESPGPINPWLGKYIFPGAYTPALSEVMRAVERSGLWVTDVEVLRLHYAETLREWRRRFIANWGKAREIYDDRFCRMWEFYLTGAEIGFRRMGLMVFQLQLARQQTAVPLTRNYIYDRTG